jgi:DNA-binding MarR family transcriptional regulator
MKMKKLSRKKFFERKQHKTSEGEFIHTLRYSYELSPKMSESIAQCAKQYLLNDRTLGEGQIEITVVSIDEKAGKIIELAQKKRIRLTKDDGIEDQKILDEHGRLGLRRTRILRITEEAIEQQGVLSQEDIARCLGCDTRTIQRDIKYLSGKGIRVITRGVLHNIGRCQSHKAKIIGMYLDGEVFSKIKLITHHSVGSIKRYLESFVQILAALHFKIDDNMMISTVTGISTYLVGEYRKLIIESRKIAIRKQRMEDMLSSWLRSEELKKTMTECGNRAVAMMGGYV